MRKLCLLLSYFILHEFAIAQDTLRTTRLEEIVISASRTEQALIEIPRSATVIDQEVIRSSVYQSLGELLSMQSGIFLTGTQQTPGTNQNVFMRGANSNQVAVLVDGVRITDPSSPNAAIDLSELSVANVERIEIIRGAHSTMYGGAAIGGVINVITKKSSREGFHGDVSWQGGLFGKGAGLSTENLHVQYGLKNGLYFNGALFRQDVRGLDATEKDPDTPSFTADRDDFEKTDASLKAGFRNDVWDAGIVFRNANQYTEVDNAAFVDDDNYYLDFDRKLLQYQVRYQISPLLSASVMGSFSGNERFYENDSSQVAPGSWDKAYSTGTYSGQLQTHEAQLNLKKGRWDVVSGFGLYEEMMSFDNYFFYNDPSFPFETTTDYDTIDTRTTTGYFFARAGYEWKRFRVSAGSRYSHHTLAGDLLNLEINPSIAFNGVLLYASLSSGYNAPSLYQLYDPTKGFSAYTTRGNRNLTPERSLSVEIGAKKQFASGSYFTLSAYRTQVDESIEYVYLWNGESPVGALTFADDRGDTYINVGKQLARGIELEGYTRISDHFTFQGNLTFLRTSVVAEPGDLNEDYTGGHHVQLYNLGSFLTAEVEQNQLVRRPDVSSFLRFNYQPISSLAFGIMHRYTGKRFDSGFDGTLGPYGGLGRIQVDAYHLVDAVVNWNVSDVLAVAARLENLLDEDFREVAGFQTRGRAVYLKVAARW